MNKNDIVFIHEGGYWYGRGGSNKCSEQYLEVLLSLDSAEWKSHLKLQHIFLSRHMLILMMSTLVNFMGLCYCKSMVLKCVSFEVTGANSRLLLESQVFAFSHEMHTKKMHTKPTGVKIP